MKSTFIVYVLLFFLIFESSFILFMGINAKYEYNQKLNTIRERDSLALIIKTRHEFTKRFPISSPVHDFLITSPYGQRKDPFIDSLVSNHKGIDILNVKKNDSVYATAKGKVVESGLNGGYGNMVIINHSAGFSTLYAHMDTIFVNVGDTVEFDTPIGIIGTTGKSTAPHLHYEIFFHDENQNPNKIIEFNIKN